MKPHALKTATPKGCCSFQYPASASCKEVKFQSFSVLQLPLRQLRIKKQVGQSIDVNSG